MRALNLGLVAVLACAFASVPSSALAQSKVRKVADLQYEGPVQFKLEGDDIRFWTPLEGQVRPGNRIDRYYLVRSSKHPPRPGHDPKTFHLQLGSYTGNVKGYWIRRNWDNARGAKQPYNCWQPQGDNSIQFWNQDAAAKGPPEDLEMFYFEIVDESQNTVRIRNRYKGYVRFEGDKLRVGTQEASHASVFTLVFP